MPARKMRVELFDGEGNKYTIAFEGQITRERALRLLDLVELLGGMPSGVDASVNAPSNNASKYDKVRLTIRNNFPIVWFTSKDIQFAYEREFREPATLSTISTYLARMAKRGMLVRMRESNRLKYKTAASFPQATLQQQIP